MFEFDMLLFMRFDMLEFDIDVFLIDEFDMFELDMVEFDIVVFDIEEFMFDIDVLVVFMFVRLALALFTAVSPQAMPSAPKARTAESAITFFITRNILLSSSKIETKLSKGTPDPASDAARPEGMVFGNNGQYTERKGL
jgi:hypothetical protein